MCKLVTSWMKLCRTQLVTEWLAVAGTLSLWGVFPQTQCHNLSCNISWPLEWLNKQDKGPFDHIWLFQLFFLFARHSSLPAPWHTFVKSLTIAKSFRSLSHSSYWVQRVGRLDKTGRRIKLLPKPPQYSCLNGTLTTVGKDHPNCLQSPVLYHCRRPKFFIFWEMGIILVYTCMSGVLILLLSRVIGLSCLLFVHLCCVCIGASKRWTQWRQLNILSIVWNLALININIAMKWDLVHLHYLLCEWY